MGLIYSALTGVPSVLCKTEGHRPNYTCEEGETLALICRTNVLQTFALYRYEEIKGVDSRNKVKHNE